MYELTVTGRFSAAHQLRNYKGKCENLHGHNWKVEATVTAADLNEIGLGMDFKDIKHALNDILNELDHLHLNDLPMFQTENPSSEVIARWIFERLSEHLDSKRVQVARVTVWESDDACATYIPEP
ncbi:MAG: 6-carboxytetrahydropterin synthase QueD [Nitrospirae bacterium CG_4_9_14_3_um_filter_53_35]|nr:MAG: 6-carboxytetrahydropterin synthase QueD [Nitrospirae bacterium CG2_30_53_67]PIS37032.1 MAG: 6-carboxytetrahydropterin synthase QueD [Nitrospirae bacterium CG08_land_8_20_14_0_20_52_24]PIV85499.1 MAG: 6-carboxytetrahydropterin synthase QueD [Nitrospirae bacterium CG17_big_fil_post_rev_8_21_14_2_50_50_9]PIW85836.1 MAG: 6-carboxytetrahydropterin synthase QueD [Nitrospirae bacterium CG_4_8_14_3_um_filter_50_41]PIX86647.1 MAG: 6-carboxytetrahydropterin synthase QueD [Nitrospirae bacterium CG